MKRLFLAPLALLLSSCAIGPNYQRPQIAVPTQFRGTQPTAPADKPAASIADVSAFDLFHDPALTSLLKTALAQNNDIHIAAERVQEERGQYGITRSAIFPSVDAVGQYSATRTSSIGSFTFIPSGRIWQRVIPRRDFRYRGKPICGAACADFTEAARAQYLATEEAHSGVVAMVIADVTTNYLTLLELDSEMEIAKSTRDDAEKGLTLTNLRHERGAATGLDVRQAEELLYTATAQIAATEREISETENALSLLLGENPTAMPRGTKLEAIPEVVGIPAGLPSTVLEKRPDIRPGCRRRWWPRTRRSALPRRFGFRRSR